MLTTDTVIAPFPLNPLTGNDAEKTYYTSSSLCSVFENLPNS